MEPLKVMNFSPVAASHGHDEIFAHMARDRKLPGTEVHIASLPPDEGRIRGHPQETMRVGPQPALVVRGATRS